MLRFTVTPLTNGEYKRNVRSTGPVPLIVFLMRNRVIEPFLLIPMQIPVKDVGLMSFSGTTCTWICLKSEGYVLKQALQLHCRYRLQHNNRRRL